MKTAVRCLIVVAVSCGWSSPGQAGPPSAEETAIRTNARAYVEAFERRDAKALAALWAPKAVYVNPESGRRAEGRDAIEKEFAAQFKNAGPAKLRLRIGQIRFISDDVAMEDGSATVTTVGGEASTSSYLAISVKQNGKWLLDSVRETETAPVSSHYEQLKELEWLVGKWVDADDAATVETTCAWTANRNFLTRSFKVVVAGRIDMQGTQVIGWDPKHKRIRSWVFDSDGGFSEGTWRREGNRWIITQTGNLVDGRAVAATNTLKRVDDDTFAWQSTGRTLDGEILPNVEEVTVVRQTEEGGD